MTDFRSSNRNPFASRRTVLGTALAAAGSLATAAFAADGATGITKFGSGTITLPVARKGRIKQSLVSWCYLKHFGNSTEKLCEAAKQLGVQSIELIGADHWPTIQKAGLSIAIASSHGFTQGMNNPKYWERCHKILTDQIEKCAAAGVPSVISFTGMREDIADDVGAKNCVEGYKKIIGLAEQKKVTICLEMLNSRYDKNMIGHPGYQGDHCDYCIDILKKVGSDRLKLLFDIYHVQIMDGDVITRIRQHKEYIGHVHTAGVPGRGELDAKQEINYPAIMQALIDVGYQGYVGQEFIPTRDAMAGLQEAVNLCDV